MCHKVICPQCNKWTWSGCGRHINQCLAGISQDKICKCNKSR